MESRPISVWFDAEGDYLEVLFDATKPGYFRETGDDRVMEKIDENGTVLGFSVLGISTLRSPTTISVGLPARNDRA